MKPAASALGILFIHDDMGEQARGDTITEMNDATTERLRRWLGNDKFRLHEATLRSREDTARNEGPGHPGGPQHDLVAYRLTERQQCERSVFEAGSHQL